MFTASRLQAVTYLLGVCLFSISFLVFLNASVSFVVTDLIGERKGVGNAVGTLGFADELVALVACPAWGVVSDRLGVRIVCVLGYAIVGLALILAVQSENVFPQLLLTRLLFSIGGAATSTMVTAILPSMTAPRTSKNTGRQPRSLEPITSHVVSSSVSSELTITPHRLSQRGLQNGSNSELVLLDPSPIRLAGFVGLFTGCGALVALGLFLPLPAQLQKAGVKPGRAVADAYYIVGTLSLLVSVACFYGLRYLHGEENKGWRVLTRNENKRSGGAQTLPYLGLLLGAMKLGYRSPLLGLSYLGGFVARASSVGISLFIPLFVNAYFISSGLCSDSSQGSKDMKQQCRRAYVLAAELSGVSQLVALLFAPVFGYLADRYRRHNTPLLTAALAGILGYSGLAFLRSPEPTGDHGSPWIFAIMALLGISQIGAIVCSLGLLGHSILGPMDASLEDQKQDTHGDRYDRTRPTAVPNVRGRAAEEINDEGETTRLLQDEPDTLTSCSDFKGSIAGVYSLAGGVGILLLTKLGGYLFDNLSPVAPFYMLSSFNALLLIVGIACGISGTTSGDKFLKAGVHADHA